MNKSLDSKGKALDVGEDRFSHHRGFCVTKGVSCFLSFILAIASINPLGRYPGMNVDTNFVKLTSSLHIPRGSCANPTVSEGLCWGFLYTVPFGAHDNVKGWCVLPRSHLRRKSSGRLGWLPKSPS